MGRKVVSIPVSDEKEMFIGWLPTGWIDWSMLEQPLLGTNGTIEEVTANTLLFVIILFT